MSDSNRSDHTHTLILVVIVAALLSIIMFQKSGYEHVVPVSNMYDSSEYKERAAHRIKAECSEFKGIGAFECKNGIEQSTRDAHRAQKDLKAQRYMALWAFIMAVSSVVGVVVTFVGVLFVKSTLDETRRAVKSADDAVNVTREIGYTQTRPWLYCLGVEWVFFKDMNTNNTPTTAMSYHTTWINSGVSPAVKVELGVISKENPSNQEMPDFSTINTNHDGADVATVGPNVKIGTPVERISGDNLGRFVSGQTSIFVYAKATYESPIGGIGSPHVSEATFRVRCTGHKGKEDGTIEPIISVEPVSNQSTMN